MKIITYNVNGLRAAVSKGLPEWLVQENPDILCLQETKLQPDQYPAEVFEALGYRAYLYSCLLYTSRVDTNTSGLMIRI